MERTKKTAAKSTAKTKPAVKAAPPVSEEELTTEQKTPDSQIDQLILMGRIKKANELLSRGEFDEAARILPAVNVFDVMHLRLLIENHVKTDMELCQQRERPLSESSTYTYLLKLSDESVRARYVEMDAICTRNRELREELERAYDLIDYGYFEEAVTFAEELSQTYPEKAEVWNLIILAKSHITPERTFQKQPQKHNASLEKFSEYKTMLSCPDFEYVSQKPEFAMRYLKTKMDILKEKQVQVEEERLSQANVYTRIRTALGIAALVTWIPFTLFFNTLAGILSAMLPLLLALGALGCNIRVNVLQPTLSFKESALSYTLILLEIAVFATGIGVATGIFL